MKEEYIGTVFIDGKMYELNDLSFEELDKLKECLKEKEKICRKKIEELLRN